METLQIVAQQLQRPLSSDSRAETIANLKAAPVSSSAWNSGGDAATIPHRQLPNDVESLKQHQIEVMEQQKRGLDVLSQTISRQRALASQLGNEVHEQNGKT